MRRLMALEAALAVIGEDALTNFACKVTMRFQLKRHSSQPCRLLQQASSTEANAVGDTSSGKLER